MSGRALSILARLATTREVSRADAREDALKPRQRGAASVSAAAASKSSAAREADAAERGLVEAAQRDSRRFAELYENNFERVYAYVARRVRDRDEAQDLTADVFHLALKNIARFEWRGVPFCAWLFRIAANEIADRSKGIAKRRTIEHSLHDDLTVRENDPPATEMVASVGETERRARLFKLVERLPRDQSRVIAMRFAEDRSIREIALAMDRSEGSIKQLQFRAVQNLRVRLGDTNG